MTSTRYVYGTTRCSVAGLRDSGPYRARIFLLTERLAPSKQSLDQEACGNYATRAPICVTAASLRR